MKIFDKDNSGSITLAEMCKDMAQLRTNIGTVLDTGTEGIGESSL